jgi:hypothetical protein
MRAPAISTPPPICRSKASTICAIHFGQCGQTDEDEWRYDTNLTLPQCRDLAETVKPSHGEMYYRDKSNNITIIEPFNSCDDRCQIAFNSCETGQPIAILDQLGVSLTQCQSHQHDNDPSFGEMVWTPADGSPIVSQNFNFCAPSECRISYRDCVTNAEVATFEQDGISVDECRAQITANQPANAKMTFTPPGGSDPIVERFATCGEIRQGYFGVTNDYNLFFWLIFSPFAGATVGSKAVYDVTPTPSQGGYPPYFARVVALRVTSASEWEVDIEGQAGGYIEWYTFQTTMRSSDIDTMPDNVYLEGPSPIE